MTDAKDQQDGASAGGGSLPQEPVERRENVGTTTPDRYPAAERQAGDVSGGANRGHRRSTGSGPVSGSGAGAGPDMDPPRRLQRDLGFADRHAADLEPFGQLALARQPRSGRVGSVQNEAPDRVGDILEKAAFGHAQSSPQLCLRESIQSGMTSLKPMTDARISFSSRTRPMPVCRGRTGRPARAPSSPTGWLDRTCRARRLRR